MTATATVSAKVLNNRRTRREQDAGKKASIILAKVVSNTFCPAEDDFMVDSAGRKVRLTKATDAEIRHMLINNRVVDTCDILEMVGETAFNNLVTNGSIKRDASFNRFKKNNLYWVTAKARELYNLPSRITLVGGAQVDYAS